MRGILALAVASSFLVSASGVQAQSEADTIDDRLSGVEQELEQLMTLYNAPSLSVAVVEDGNIVFASALGFSDLEDQTPATLRTQYGVGSIVKTFTSGLVGVLEGDGTISRSTPVAPYWEGLDFGSADTRENLTVARLLSQTSGLGDLSGSIAFFPASEQHDIGSRLNHFPMACRVGDCWKYNNLNFVMLDAVVEKATGLSKAQLIQDRLLKPAGMSDSVSSTALFDASETAASGYVMSDGKARGTTTEYLFGEHVYATASDLGRWINVWMNGGGGVLPSGYVHAAISMQAISDGSPPKETDPGAYLSGYGYGWRVRSRGGQYQVEHGGNENGFSSQVLFVPATKMGVVALTNQQNSILPYIANDILMRRVMGQGSVAISDYPVQVQSAAPLLDPRDARLSLNEEEPPTLDTSELVGRYEAPGYGLLTVSFSEGSLTLTTPAADFVLTHRAGDRYDLGSTAPIPAGINVEFFSVEFFEGSLTANFADPEVRFRKVD